MGITTAIEWTDHTFNTWWGCTKVSPGCANCYAERDSNRWGTKWGKGQPRRVFGTDHWRQPLQWNVAAKAEGVRRRVFCASMADVFEEQAIASEMVKLWELIRATPHLDWQLLTKRPHLIASRLPADWGEGYANVWLGTSVEDQNRADERIPHLLAVPARVRFLSCEPLLDAVTLHRALGIYAHSGPPCHIEREGWHALNGNVRACGLHWVIAGGESGPQARPMHPDWARSLRDQCAAADVPFLFKQWGEWAPGECAEGKHVRTEQVAHHSGNGWEFGTVTPRQSEEMHRDDEPELYRIGKKAAGRYLDGVVHDGMPA